MTLHIANPSRQNCVFPYRDPANPALLHYIDLRSGTQDEIGQTWTAEQTAAVIRQLERHGGRDAAEAHGSMGRFMGLLYRDIGQITESEIVMGNEAELQTRDDRAVSQATRAALGFDRAVRGAKNGRPPARVTGVEVEQERGRGERRQRGDVAFGLTVDPEGRSDVKLPV